MRLRRLITNNLSNVVRFLHRPNSIQEKPTPTCRGYSSAVVQQVIGRNDVTQLSAQSVPATRAEYLQKLLLQQPYTPKEDPRLLKVAVIGCPNAGKSSLVNMLVRWRVCAVAGKAHTTRSKQMAALMQDNVQVVFTDLPGLVNSGKAWKFNLDKSFMRDPHAAIFDSDLILVVVDVTHKRSREELDPEIIKALHFFDDKESVLVLNKIDKARNNPTRLLEVTRRLTRGVVSGRQSHQDAYAARFIRRQRLMLTTHRLLPPSEVIANHLPAACHEEMQLFLAHLSEVRRQLAGPVVSLTSHHHGIQTTMALPWSEDEGVLHPDPTSERSQTAQTSNDRQHDSDSILPTDASVECPVACEATSDTVVDERLVTGTELDSIDAFFEDYLPSPEGPFTEQPEDSQLPVNCTRVAKGEDGYLTALTEILEEQLLLKSATPEEVKLRRQQWLDISLKVKGTRDWSGFNEVFMVSSAAGDGVDLLRNYLVSKAVPNRRWLLSPLLVTDQEPGELVRMCVWAHCLQRLRQEVPYSLRIVVDDCERAARLADDDGDDRVFVHARIQCRSERHLRQVLGIGGSTIREIAAAVKLELMTMFRANTVVKLTAEMISVRPAVMRQLRRAKDFGEVFPDSS